MGRIVVSEFVSIDGVMEAPGGEPGHRHTNWVGRMFDAEPFAEKLQEILDHEAMLLGRVTYESFAGAWPQSEGAMADKLNAMPKFVASRTMTTAAWNNSTVLKGELADMAARLKTEVEGDILVHGSRSVVNVLRQANLVDEYRLMVFPIVLGSGMQLFDQTPTAQIMALTSSRAYESGILSLTYSAGAVEAGVDV